MKPEDVLVKAFSKLAETAGREYGIRVSLTASPGSFVLRVRTRPRPDVGEFPSYLVTVRPTGRDYLCDYRPTGWAAAEAERWVVAYDSPGVVARLFKDVTARVTTERLRLIEYWAKGSLNP